MAFVPFVETDQPTMEAFNEKFRQNFEAAINGGLQIVTGSYAGTSSNTTTAEVFSKTFLCGFKPQIFLLANDEITTVNTTGAAVGGFILWFEGIKRVLAGDSSLNYYKTFTITQTDEGISIVSESKQYPHFNKSGATYYWIAIGRKEE